MALPRMRTVKEAMGTIKEADPHTALSEHAIRRLIKTGHIPVVTSGRRFLINLDTLLDYLENPEESHPLQNETAGTIRRIEI